MQSTPESEGHHRRLSNIQSDAHARYTRALIGLTGHNRFFLLNILHSVDAVRQAARTPPTVGASNDLTESSSTVLPRRHHSNVIAKHSPRPVDASELRVTQATRPTPGQADAHMLIVKSRLWLSSGCAWSQTSFR